MVVNGQRGCGLNGDNALMSIASSSSSSSSAAAAASVNVIAPYANHHRALSYTRTTNGGGGSGRWPRKPGTYNFKEENIKSHTDANGVVYKVAEHVYMDINKPNQPFAIACVLDFKLVILQANSFLSCLSRVFKEMTKQQNKTKKRQNETRL